MGNIVYLFNIGLNVIISIDQKLYEWPGCSFAKMMNSWGQFGHSYTFWTMAIMIFCPVSNFADQSLENNWKRSLLFCNAFGLAKSDVENLHTIYTIKHEVNFIYWWIFGFINCSNSFVLFLLYFSNKNKQRPPMKKHHDAPTKVSSLKVMAAIQSQVKFLDFFLKIEKVKNNFWQ